MAYIKLVAVHQQRILDILLHDPPDPGRSTRISYLGLYGRPMPRVLGGWAFSCGRGTPVPTIAFNTLQHSQTCGRRPAADPRHTSARSTYSRPIHKNQSFFTFANALANSRYKRQIYFRKIRLIQDGPPELVFLNFAHTSAQSNPSMPIHQNQRFFSPLQMTWKQQIRPGGNPWAHGWFIKSTLLQTPPPGGSICGRLTKDLPSTRL